VVAVIDPGSSVRMVVEVACDRAESALIMESRVDSAVGCLPSAPGMEFLLNEGLRPFGQGPKRISAQVRADAV
jgi:hypothetical protein